MHFCRMTTPNKKKMKTADHLPRRSLSLDDVPDCLYPLIASHLPITDSVASSALSKSWRSAWKHSPRLDLECLARLSPPSPVHILHVDALITHILRSHLAPLHSCRISCYVQLSSTGVPKWVDLLNSKGARELVLDCRNFNDAHKWPKVPWPLPRLAFNSWSLRALELNHCFIQSAATFSGCVGLKSLTLNHVSVSGDHVIEGVVKKYCVGLEELVMRMCVGKVEEVRVVSGRMRRLEVSMMKVKRVVIECENLVSLRMDGMRCDGFEVRVPSLLAMHTCSIVGRAFECDEMCVNKRSTELKRSNTCKYTLKMLACCTHINECRFSYEKSQFWTLKKKWDDQMYSPEKTTMDSYIPFYKMRRLSLNVNLNDPRQLILFTFFINQCIYLSEINIKVEKQILEKLFDENCLPCTEERYWKTRIVPDCVLYQLKKIVVSGLTGKKLELEFLKFILAEAPLLENMTLHCSSTDCSITILGLLCWSPRLSRKAQIIFRPLPTVKMTMEGRCSDNIYGCEDY
ncbi:F-box/FBD/LRR-repeat protein [Acorus gramineus]|uniref:F-box/FBD/LRR-repeat protein n=1 Tax=Acorus gramineus TaxID=55184 RepID=A0AAV9AMK3_ACOGR|nr:F-box/FBD/LRR-repeat protein [Acorus gramineus]